MYSTACRQKTTLTYNSLLHVKSSVMEGNSSLKNHRPLTSPERTDLLDNKYCLSF